MKGIREENIQSASVMIGNSEVSNSKQAVRYTGASHSRVSMLVLSSCLPRLVVVVVQKEANLSI